MDMRLGKVSKKKEKLNYLGQHPPGTNQKVSSFLLAFHKKRINAQISK